MAEPECVFLCGLRLQMTQMQAVYGMSGIFALDADFFNPIKRNCQTQNSARINLRLQIAWIVLMVQPGTRLVLNN